MPSTVDTTFRLQQPRAEHAHRSDQYIIHPHFVGLELLPLFLVSGWHWWVRPAYRLCWLVGCQLTLHMHSFVLAWALYLFLDFVFISFAWVWATGLSLQLVLQIHCTLHNMSPPSTWWIYAIARSVLLLSKSVRKWKLKNKPTFFSDIFWSEQNLVYYWIFVAHAPCLAHLFCCTGEQSGILAFNTDSWVMSKPRKGEGVVPKHDHGGWKTSMMSFWHNS